MPSDGKDYRHIDCHVLWLPKSFAEPVVTTAGGG